ncbi:MAG: hypothetical protein V3U54_05650 [Thermodesulfobacteriota bacterium]
MKAKEVLIFFLSLSTFIFSGCTSNPLSDDEISGGMRQITGKIEVSDNQSSEGVYVWLEGFDIGTFTDQDGEFEITLPSTAQNSGGATGIFNLYYYLANYKLTKTELTVRSGEFVFATGEINNKGELQRPKFLSRILDISTVLTPPTADADSSIFMKVEVVLSSETDSVTVLYPREPFDGPNKLIAPLFVKNLETGTAFYVEPTLAGINEEDIITIFRGRPFVRTMLLIMSKGVLSEGEYEIIPYLRISQPEVPAELLNNLVEDIDSFGLDYLNVPFLRTNGVLSVIKGGGGVGGN